MNQVMPKIKLSFILKHLTYFYVAMLAHRLAVQDLYCLLFLLARASFKCARIQINSSPSKSRKTKKHLERALFEPGTSCFVRDHSNH